MKPHFHRPYQLIPGNHQNDILPNQSTSTVETSGERTSWMMLLSLRILKKALLVVFFVSISLLGTDLEYQIKMFVQLTDI